MPTTAKTLSKTPSTFIKATLLTAALVLACFAQLQRARADSGLCADGVSCVDNSDRDRSLVDFLPTRLTAEGNSFRRSLLSEQEYLSFSGVGVIVCSVNGKQRASTAFLVGAFDIGVTVAHTFAEDGNWAQPNDCVYTSMDSLGQIRERIPVSYIKAQWESEDGAFGQPTKDFAVVRLSQPSRYAQRTMPLGKFSGAAAPVVMVGFKSDIEADTIKRKTRGTVYERRANGLAISSLAGFTHDMDSRGIAAGAPVMDERSGVIIGIHTVLASNRNTMITMNEWLERTIKFEMESPARAN
jgi:hypothetical protein